VTDDDRDPIRVEAEIQRIVAMFGTQPWVEEWLNDPLIPGEEGEQWLRDRPDNLHNLIWSFPPSCVVKANRDLHCPAPGTLGIVQSYQEKDDGTEVIGVIQEPDGVIRAQCQRDWLEVVGYRLPCTPAWVDKVLGLNLSH